MVDAARTLSARWDWRLSALARLASLVSMWLLVFGAALLGPLLPLVGLVRFAFSTVQLVLNQRLARRIPLGTRPRSDWVLLALAFLGSCLVATLREGGVSLPLPVLLLPVLVPFSAIQVRSIRRSLAVHARTTGAAREPIPFRRREDDARRAA